MPSTQVAPLLTQQRPAYRWVPALANKARRLNQSLRSLRPPDGHGVPKKRQFTRFFRWQLPPYATRQPFFPSSERTAFNAINWQPLCRVPRWCGLSAKVFLDSQRLHIRIQSLTLGSSTTSAASSLTVTSAVVGLFRGMAPTSDTAWTQAIPIGLHHSLAPL